MHDLARPKLGNPERSEGSTDAACAVRSRSNSGNVRPRTLRPPMRNNSRRVEHSQQRVVGPAIEIIDKSRLTETIKRESNPPNQSRQRNTASRNTTARLGGEPAFGRISLAKGTPT